MTKIIAKKFVNNKTVLYLIVLVINKNKKQKEDNYISFNRRAERTILRRIGIKK